MKILSNIDCKNIDQNTPDISIGITEDDGRKFKFKRPLMLKIFIPLSILILSTIVLLLLALSYKFDELIDKNSDSKDEHIKNLLRFREYIRNKRQLDEYKDWHNEQDYYNLHESIVRCKKNIEQNLDCCDLHKSIRTFQDVIGNVYKDFDMSQIPCKNEESIEINEESKPNTDENKTPDIVNDEEYLGKNEDSYFNNANEDTTTSRAYGIYESDTENINVNIKVDVHDSKSEEETGYGATENSPSKLEESTIKLEEYYPQIISTTKEIITMNEENPDNLYQKIDDSSLSSDIRSTTYDTKMEEVTKTRKYTQEDIEQERDKDDPVTSYSPEPEYVDQQNTNYDENKQDEYDNPNNNHDINENLVHSIFTTPNYNNDKETDLIINQDYTTILPEDQENIRQYDSDIQPATVDQESYSNNKDNIQDNNGLETYEYTTIATQQLETGAPEIYDSVNNNNGAATHKIVNKHLNNYYTESAEGDIIENPNSYKSEEKNYETNSKYYDNYEPTRVEIESTSKYLIDSTTIRFDHEETYSNNQDQETKDKYDVIDPEEIPNKNIDEMSYTTLQPNNENTNTNIYDPQNISGEEFRDQLKRMEVKTKSLETESNTELNNQFPEKETNAPEYIYKEDNRQEASKQLQSDHLIKEEEKSTTENNNYQTENLGINKENQTPSYTTEKSFNNRENDYEHHMPQSTTTEPKVIAEYENHSNDNEENDYEINITVKVDDNTEKYSAENMETTKWLQNNYENDNSVKDDPNEENNADSVDDYTDSQGNTEDLENSHENRYLLESTTLKEDQQYTSTVSELVYSTAENYQRTEKVYLDETTERIDEKDDQKYEIHTEKKDGQITYDEDESRTTDQNYIETTTRYQPPQNLEEYDTNNYHMTEINTETYGQNLKMASDGDNFEGGDHITTTTLADGENFETTKRKSDSEELVKFGFPTVDHRYFHSEHEKIDETTTNSVSNQPRSQDGNINDVRIVNQNPMTSIAQRFQNIGSGSNSKFDNIFQLPPVETSKASQQLTVNTNMLPMCFFGVPGQNGQIPRQPAYDSAINPFSVGSYGAFGYPQMYLNNLNQQPMANYYNSMMAQHKYPNFVSQPSYMNNPYFCTYVPSSSLQFPPISGVSEFRNIEDKNFHLPEDIDDKTIPKDLFPHLINQNKSRSSAHCKSDEKSCFDGIQCVKNFNWCDGRINCKDKSDELGCPCRTRVNKNKLCDGYFDCPNGEDELGCFGCSEEEFSCDDWSERQKAATCVPVHERCDGIPQCQTGKDEMDCSLLTNSINVHQTYAVSKSSGFLHRNFKGSWYPVCSNTDTWVLDACLAEVGPQATLPLVHLLPVPKDYDGEYLTALPNQKIEFLKSCIGGEAIYVICPPIPCGTRLLPPPNHFRKLEVDTSAEEDFLPFVSRLRRFTDELHKDKHHPDILSSNDFTDKNHHVTLEKYVNKYIDIHNEDWSWEEQERRKRGDTRVVGGRPSQPTSWPWVVAIYRDGIFHCGGVLMSELWIITAAHCVDTYWQHYYEVQGGMLRRFSFSPMEQNRVVSNIIGHQLYDRTDMKNDLALLKVGQPFQFNRWVRPVCLPSESSAGPNWMWGPQPGTICTAVGWGATIEHGPDPDHMREVEVPILSHCKHREDEEGQEICAGYLEGGRDACQGDSGGPLLCRNPLAPSQWYVAGIVSHGEGCARPNEPGAYTRVSLYLNWIARSILDENLPKRKPIQKCPGTLCLGSRRCISKKRRCDKTIDCLVGDDELNCPNLGYSALIKHAFENMLLFSPNNVTTNQPEDEENFEEIEKIDKGTEIPKENQNSTSNTLIIDSTTLSGISTKTENSSNGALNTNNTKMSDTDSKDSMKNASKSILHEIPSYFECRKMLQLIPMSRRCDKIIDCEDGTDEAGCSCKGYLYSSHPKAICDGIIDCADGSDEKNCINCPETHFHCHLSQQCIPKSKQCNHVADCFFTEDEWDCFALTNGSYIRYDSDERPELRGKGVMSFSFSGKWFPLCNNNWFQTAHDVAGDMCAYLGFSGYQKYKEAEVKQSNLEIISKNSTSLSFSSSTNETCRGLYVKCSNSLSDTTDVTKIYTAHQSGANTFKEALMSPWNAAIFVDGVYTCSGTLIEKNWVVTSRTCLHHIHLHLNYTAVMLGSGRGHFNVIGPHEQIRQISEMVPVIITDILLLRLQKPVTFTRYVRPLYVKNINNDIVSEKETCIALGKENDSFMQIIVLKPLMEKCVRGKRCFKRVTPLGRCNVETSEWGGNIVCLSESGWYPAAVYFDQKGICGFHTTAEYTSIRNHKARIVNAMNKHDFPVSPPNCNGIRCPLGKCISEQNICDGISDCRDGSDENEELCYQKAQSCTATKTCECAPGELSCKNGRCVSKSAFCDRVNDCGDWSDEPARCDCSTYLSLVAPHRLCDGISNCHDKSDENPRVCPCRPDSFTCSGLSKLCIPNDWICDGEYDCPEKEDEKFCLAFRAQEGERDGVGEVVLRSYGIWHSYCIKEKPLTIPDLEEICTELGFKSSHAAVVNRTYHQPAQDVTIENFSLVRFNEHVMMFLKGDYPIAKLQENEKCERLYIECTPP